MYKKLFSVILSSIIITLLIGNTAYAANSDYLDENKWHNNPNVKTFQINKSSIGNTLNGTFSMAKDNDNLVLYTYLSFDESTLTGNCDDDIRVVYEFSTANEMYAFSVDRYGICEDMGEAAEMFEVGQNFYYYDGTPQVISYAQFLGKCDVSANVYLFVNNTRYLIRKDIRLVLPVKTTTKKVTTTKPKTTKKKSTTKAKSSAKKSSRSGSYSRSGSKKYYNGAVGTTKAKASTTKNITTITDTTKAAITEEQRPVATEGKLSSNSKMLLYAGIAVGVVALILIFYSLGYASATGKRDKKEETDTED